MIYLFCIMIPYLLGRGALRAFYRETGDRDFSRADSMLTGGLVVIGLAEAAHMGAVILGRSFSDCVKLFLVGMVLLLGIAGILLVMESRRKQKDMLAVKEANRRRVETLMTKKTLGTEDWSMLFVFVVLVVFQLLFIVMEQKRYLTGDMTVEMVNGMLSTNTIYQVNPMTGQPYSLGMPMRLKILSLPTLYAILCHLFDMSAIQVVWTLAPVFTLLGSYMAFHTVAGALFPEDRRKRSVFMIFVALLLWVGDYMYGMDGFALQYAGFRGVSIRMLILVPYTFGLVLRKKWKLVALCVLAEACIVWTLYGMGACLLVTIGMVVPGILAKVFAKWKVQTTGVGKQPGGKEDSE